jgi:hypothetical protein
VLVGDNARTDLPQGAPHYFPHVTGVDCFSDILYQEQRHVKQVEEHDALNPYSVSRGGQFNGYSWGTARTVQEIANLMYNHFRVGPDGAPGQHNVDDDSDGTTDNEPEFVAGPPNPSIPNDAGSVVHDDEDLDRDGDQISHLVPTDPDPYPTSPDFDLPEAQARAAMPHLQDGHRTLDWGDPGKMHGPDLSTPNARGELNAYDD